MSAQADKPFSYSASLCHRSSAALQPFFETSRQKNIPTGRHSVRKSVIHCGKNEIQS
jgi:hypothetical protein